MQCMERSKNVNMSRSSRSALTTVAPATTKSSRSRVCSRRYSMARCDSVFGRFGRAAVFTFLALVVFIILPIDSPLAIAKVAAAAATARREALPQSFSSSSLSSSSFSSSWRRRRSGLSEATTKEVNNDNDGIEVIGEEDRRSPSLESLSSSIAPEQKQYDDDAFLDENVRYWGSAAQRDRNHDCGDVDSDIDDRNRDLATGTECKDGEASNTKTTTTTTTNTVLPLNLTSIGPIHDGYGAVSAGGTNRLLVDYPAVQRGQILDVLFKPNFASSLQALKVEIGGDSQSTDGTEASHMRRRMGRHTRRRRRRRSQRKRYDQNEEEEDEEEGQQQDDDDDVVDCNAGYEFWLLREAKKRNPRLVTAALPWAFPGWVADGSYHTSMTDLVSDEDSVGNFGTSETAKINGSENDGDSVLSGIEPRPPWDDPYSNPNSTSDYVLRFLECARDRHGILLDYVGLWNEKNTDGESRYAQTLRAVLDRENFHSTKIIARDGWPDVCSDLRENAAYNAVVGVVGLHYPVDYGTPGHYDECLSLHKPMWSSEDYGSYSDSNGAACLARMLAAHHVESGMTSSWIWTHVGAYYHGTNWYSSSLLEAAQPWSGWYQWNGEGGRDGRCGRGGGVGIGGNGDGGCYKRGEEGDGAPAVWAMAHYTQFTAVGWRYLTVGDGSGRLPLGGYYVSLVSPVSEDDRRRDFTLIIVKISRDHAQCVRPPLPDFDVEDEIATFRIVNGGGGFGFGVDTDGIENGGGGNRTILHAWRSNFESDPDSDPILFRYQGTVLVRSDGSFVVPVAVGDVWTVSTVDYARRGAFRNVGGVGEDDKFTPASRPTFPMPYRDDFEGRRCGGDSDELEKLTVPRYFSDQIGSWEIHPEATQFEHLSNYRSAEAPILRRDGQRENYVLRQMVLRQPVAWMHTHRGPVTLIGMKEFNDLSVSVKFRLFPTTIISENGSSFKERNGGISSSKDLVAACLGVRVDQLWDGGIVLCLSARGNWTLSYGGPQIGGWYVDADVIATGEATKSPGLGEWHTLNLTVCRDEATGMLDGTESLFGRAAVRDIESGFVAVGTNSWVAVEFDDFHARLVGDESTHSCAESPAPCLQDVTWSGQTLGVAPCARNGAMDPRQGFALGANWHIRHVASGLCAEAKNLTGRFPTGIYLAPCRHGAVLQQFRNDYSTIRQKTVPITLGSYGALSETWTLVAYGNGTVAVQPSHEDEAENEQVEETAVVSWRGWCAFPNTGQLRNQYVTNLTLGYPMCLAVMPSVDDKKADA